MNLLDDFVPRKLSKRNVASKKASLFDIMGKLSPITISSTVLMRNTFKSMAGAGWDDAISAELRSQWLKEFLLWEQLRGIQYNRAVMPEEAINSKLRLIVGADAAEPVLEIGAWAGFEKGNGTWSC